MPHFILDLLSLHLAHLFSLPPVSFVICALCRYQYLDEEVQHLDTFFVSTLGILTTNFAQNCFFLIPRKVYFIKFKLFSSPKVTKKFEWSPRPVHSSPSKKWYLRAILPSHMLFFLCVTSSLSIHPFFFRPSVCPSISLSVSLLSVSWTAHLLKLLVFLSARVPALPFAGIPVLMLGCQLHNYCLFVRPYVCISFLVLSFLYLLTQSNL